MRIVQFGYTFLPLQGGEEAYILNLSRCLKRNGLSTLVIQRGFRKAYKPGESEVRTVPVSFLAPDDVNGPVIDRQLVYGLVSIPALFRTANKGDVLIVYYPQLFFPGVMLLKALKGVKVICVNLGITWDKPNMSLKEKLLYAYIQFLEKLSLRIADQTVATDSRYLREAEKWNLRPRKRIITIFNFVDTEFYTPGGTGKKTILCPRNLRHARGIDLAIRAMQKVNRSHGDAKLIILGEGPLKGEMQQLIGRLKVNAEIRSPVKGEELRRYYRQSAAVLVPSRYSEGTSLAALEAMACGKPVIVSNVGGLPDLVKNLETGLVVEPDAEEIGNAIIKVLDDKPLARRLGRSARQAAVSRFSSKTWCQSWMEAIGRVAGGKQATSQALR